jgi:hypothetical protein
MEWLLKLNGGKIEKCMSYMVIENSCRACIEEFALKYLIFG